MKLTYTVNAKLPTQKAHGTQIAKMCEAFASQDLKLTLYLPSRKQTNDSRKHISIYDYYSVGKNFQIKKVFTLDFLDYSFLGKKILSLMFLLEETIFSLLVFLITYSHPVVYTRTKLVALLRSIFNRPVFLEVHDFTVNSSINRFLAKRISGIIGTTPANTQFWRQLHAPALVAPNAVSQEFFPSQPRHLARSQLNISQQDRLIGYIGNLETLGMKKGIDNLIEAFSLLCQIHQHLHLLIVGGPQDLINFYQQQVIRLNLSQQVTFTGAKPFSQIPTYLQACDILTIPFPNQPHFAHHASPIKLYEYMASGKPIVASKLPSHTRVLKDTAVYFKPGDSHSLALAITTLITDKTLAARLGRQSQKLAQKNTWNSRAVNILAFIAQNLPNHE